MEKLMVRLLISECEGPKFRQTDPEDFTLDGSTWAKIWITAGMQWLRLGGKIEYTLREFH